MAKHTKEELIQWQALPLEVKVQMTCYRIREWVREYGEEGVYVSFSGGKDSTVLLHLVREVCGYKNVEAVFVNVPTQYPELKSFATSFDKVTILNPSIGYMQVVEKYGFPFISKEVSECVNFSRRYLESVSHNADLIGKKDFANAWAIADMIGVERRSPESKEIYEMLKKGVIPSSKKYVHGLPTHLLEMFVELPHKENGVVTNEYSKMYDKSRYAFLLDAPFEVSKYCCDIMKKRPAHDYQKKTGKHPIIGTMASESRLRTMHWIKEGCNAFDSKEPISKPLSFWTEQDILQYVKTRNLDICSVYGEVIEDLSNTEQVEGQMTISDLEGFEGDTSFDAKRPKLKTTGCTRTGCVLCGFGAHCKGDTRFVDLKATHPGLYGLMDKIQSNGVTMREAIDWINEHGNLDIKY